MSDSKIVGFRLTEERERLHATQTDFALIALKNGAPGGTQQSVARYESGLQKPSVNFLAAIATVGVDVNYVLTGVRNDRLVRDAVLQVLDMALNEHLKKPEARLDAEAYLYLAEHISNGILARKDDGTPFVLGLDTTEVQPPKRRGRPPKA